MCATLFFVSEEWHMEKCMLFCETDNESALKVMMASVSVFPLWGPAEEKGGCSLDL